MIGVSNIKMQGLRSKLIINIIMLGVIMLIHINSSLANNHILAYQYIDLKNDTVIAEKNIDNYMMTASVQKIITSYCALKVLSPDYRFYTNAYMDIANIKNGIYEGNLILQFSGSPDFKAEHIAQIFKKIKSLGVREIKGKILIDGEIFDHHSYPPGAEADDLNFCYMAPISAVSINKNCHHVSLIKNKNRVDIQNSKLISSAINLNSSAKLTDNYNLTQKYPFELRYNENNQYDLFGNYYIKNKLPNLRVAIRSPEASIAKLINYYAKIYDITVPNEVQLAEKIKYNNYKNIYTHESRPLKILLSEVLLYSDNFISNVLFKTMAYEKYGKPGTFKNGSRAVAQELSKLGINGLVIQDGAGFRRNLNSIKSINKVLLAIYHNPKMLPIFRDYLPLSGKNCRACLTDKFKNLPSDYQILAKSGTLDNIYALSGYILKGRKPVYAFTIALNQYNGSKKDAYKLFEKEIRRVLLK
ncbi:MAG: hypothetical protein DGJ47_000879 [Rickettsiaceae bacterium]